jgi:DNA-directed RNA polymerase subunit RPC12/RpoP
MMITREEYISTKSRSAVSFSDSSKNDPSIGDSESGIDELSELQALMHIKCIRCSKPVLLDDFFCPFCGSVILQNMLIKGIQIFDENHS